jgi:hypothetical protein
MNKNQFTKRMRTSSIALISTLGLLACVAASSAADGYTTMAFRCQYNGVDYGGDGFDKLFLDTFYAGACTNTTHLTPNPGAHTYPHSHLPDTGFGFTWVIGTQNVTITAAMSDLAWDDRYLTGDLRIVGGTYTKKSGSTFALNCWAFAVGAPTVMFNAGWLQWTDSVTDSCAAGSLSRGIGVGHCISICTTAKYEGDSICYVTYTKEKYASGGQYDWCAVAPYRGQNPTGWTIRKKHST